MAATTITKGATIKEVLNNSDLNEVADVLKKVKAGTMFSRVKAVITGLVGAASFNITSAAVKAGAVVTGLDLAVGENLPPIDTIASLQVTAGTAAAIGSYIVAPVGATVLNPPGGANVAVGVATLSDDGTTLTFAGAAITAFTIVYHPQPDVALNSEFAASAPGN